MSSAMCFNLDQSKILSSGNGLNIQRVNALLSTIIPNKVNMDLFTLEAFVDNKIEIMTQMTGERTFCWLPAFSPPKLFSNCVSIRVFKSLDFTVKD